MTDGAATPGRRGHRGLRLWVKLALFACVGVAATHAVQLAVGTRIATRSLAWEQEALGRVVARLVAREAVDPILTRDAVTLSQVVGRAAATHEIAYCFVVRDGETLATSFGGAGTPAALVALRTGGRTGPIVVVDDGRRLLDLEEPILGGQAGAVRLGLAMDSLETTRTAIALPLGLLALCVTALGIAAALLVGRSVAGPAGDLVAAADRFDPTAPVTPVVPRGGPELSTLAERFNGMMERLHLAHEEQERVRAPALASARLASLGAVVAGVAHEVNNPLASLKACVTLLRENGDPAERAADLDMMEEAVERLRDVVRRLLDLGNPRPLQAVPTPVLDLAREAPRLAALSLRGRGIELDELVEPGAADALVLADRKQVAQALLNLLLNAAYVTAPGGRVRIRVRRRDGLRGIAVEDDGPGVPPELRERIADPFFTTKPAGVGTGLGLALTRTIAQQHRGTLEFEFPGAGGTVATLWLPVATSLEGTAGLPATAH